MTRFPHQWLVLWDIDHTLLSIGRISREIYARAFEIVTGQQLTALADMTGRTEHAIITDTLGLNGVTTTAETFSRFYTALGEAAEELKHRMVEAGNALPGTRAAVDALARDGAIQSVVTGNIHSIAVAKLAAFGLGDAGIDLDTGGYGDRSGDRAILVRWAIARNSEKYGISFSPQNTVVIGDTPHDVKGAHDAGARALGVATGRSSREELLAAGADAAVDDLSDTESFRALLAAVVSSATSET